MHTLNHLRMVREKKTVEAMVGIYCRGMHSTAGQLCPECDQLHQYAIRRLEKCPFQEAKPTCARCPIHCYKPEAREQIKEVMRFAGPRMLPRHPAMAIRHLLDGWQSDKTHSQVHSTTGTSKPPRR